MRATAAALVAAALLSSGCNGFDTPAELFRQRAGLGFPGPAPVPPPEPVQPAPAPRVPPPAPAAPRPFESPPQALAYFDDRYLAPVDLPALRRTGPGVNVAELEGYASALSPSRRVMAFGRPDGRVDLVDTRVFVRFRNLRRPAPGGVVEVLWPREDRLWVAALSNEGLVIEVYDPERPEPIRRFELPGELLAWEPWGEGVVLMRSARRGRLDTARLDWLRAAGRSVHVAIPRILAGFESSGVPSRDPRVVPGLAVDDLAGTAFVVAAGGPFVAEVDILSGEVDLHRVGDRARVERPVSQRDARWLGFGRLAYTGFHLSETGPVRGVGVWIVDTDAWTRRRVARDAEQFTVYDDVVLTDLVSRRRRSRGILALDADGRRLWELDGYYVQAVVDGLIYAQRFAAAAATSPDWFVLDLHEGLVLERFSAPSVVALYEETG